MPWVRVVLPVIILVIVLSGCNGRSRTPEPTTAHNIPEAAVGKERSAPAASGGAPAPNSGRETPPSSPSDRITLDLPATSDGGTPASGAAGPNAGSSRFVVPHGTLVRLFPLDTVIGQLADPESSDPLTRDVYRVTDRFLKGVVAGEVREALFAAGARARLQDLVSYQLEQVPKITGYRIGTVTDLGNGNATCAVRLLSEIGRASGEVYVAQSGGSWYISDVLVDFAALGDPYPVRDKRFEPGAETPLVGVP